MNFGPNIIGTIIRMLTCNHLSKLLYNWMHGKGYTARTQISIGSDMQDQDALIDYSNRTFARNKS